MKERVKEKLALRCKLLSSYENQHWYLFSFCREEGSSHELIVNILYEQCFKLLWLQRFIYMVFD